MSDQIADAAICLLTIKGQDTSNSIHEAIRGCGPDFSEACNELSLRVARRLLAGDLSFGEADQVMNWVWARIIDCALQTIEAKFPEPACSIFKAIDEGEYHHSDDSPDVDPVEKYTKPWLQGILSEVGYAAE